MLDLIRSPRLLAMIAAASILSGATLSHAQAPATAPAARPQANMRAMGAPFNALKTQVADASKNADSLKLVATLLKESVAAKSAVPPLITALPEAEQAAKLAAYQKEMNELIRQELDLEEQLLAGDNTKAAATVAAIGATQAEGHRDFRPARGGARGGGAGRGPAGAAPGGTPAPTPAP